jgi:aryl-alcohol dehydrogenase-like predicted oxidoreductase
MPATHQIAPLRRLGPDAPTVGSIGYGCMALSFKERPSEVEAVRVIHAVLDRGVTLLDTADIYTPDRTDLGHNERLVAKALREWTGSRERVVVATKGGYTLGDDRLVPNGRPAYLRQACERSLKALGVETIDLYQLHSPDPTMPFAETIGALRALRDEGKVRWIGLSNVTLVQIDEARAIVPIQTVQNSLNLFRRDAARTGFVSRLEQSGIRGIRQLRRLVLEPFQSGVLAQCERLGLGFLAYSPLGGSWNQRLADKPVLQQIARAHGTSPHAVALAWVLAQGSTVIPIPSSRTIAHATDAIGAGTLALSAAEIAAIGRTAAE